MQFVRLLVLLIIILLPFYPIQVKPLTSLPIIGLGIILVLLSFRYSQIFLKKISILDFAFGCFLVSSALATFFSEHLILSLRTLALYFSFFMVFKFSGKLFPSFEEKKVLVSSLISVVTVLTMISLFMILVLHTVNKDILGTGFLWIYYGHNHISALHIFVIPTLGYFLYEIKHRTWNQWLLRSLLFILVVGLLLSFSRGAVTSLVVAGLLTLALFKSVTFKKLLYVTILAVFLIALYLSTLNQTGAFFGIKRIGWNEGGRLTYWEISVWNGLTHPFFGTGLDSTRFLPPPKDLIRSDYSHNFFIQLFSDGGFTLLISGVALFTILFFQLFEKIRALPKDSDDYRFQLAIWVGLLASFLNSLVDFDWQIPLVFFVFWLLSGIIYDKQK